MKFLLSLLCAALLSGCATTTLRPIPPEVGAAGAQGIVNIAATRALAKNPRYIPVAEALAAGVDAALGESAKIDPAQLSLWVRSVCATHHVSAEDVPLFVSIVQTLYDVYSAAYGTGPLITTDARVQLYAKALRDGLRAAVAAVKTTWWKGEYGKWVRLADDGVNTIDEDGWQTMLYGCKGGDGCLICDPKWRLTKVETGTTSFLHLTKDSIVIGGDTLGKR